MLSPEQTHTEPQGPTPPPIRWECAYLFGTFNPVHLGHLQLAQQTLTQFKSYGLKRVEFIPSGNHPFKQQDPELLSLDHRLAMLSLALETYPAFSINPIEMDLSAQQPTKPTYTSQTLSHLATTLNLKPNERLPMIAGGDLLAQLPQWYEPQRVIDQVCFLQARRSHSHPNKVQPTETLFYTAVTLDGQSVLLTTLPLDLPLLPIASTQIRSAIMAQEPEEQWIKFVPSTVADYIQRHHLWGND